jgi:hypothetical protein
MKLFALILFILVVIGAGAIRSSRLAKFAYHGLALLAAALGLALVSHVAGSGHLPIVLRDPALAAALLFFAWGGLFAVFGLETYRQTVAVGVYGVVHGTIAACLGIVGVSLFPGRAADLAALGVPLAFLLWSSMALNAGPAASPAGRRGPPRLMALLSAACVAVA